MRKNGDFTLFNKSLEPYKRSLIVYVSSEGGRTGPAKSVLVRMGGEERFICNRMHTIIFFAGSLQNRNVLFRKRNVDLQGSSWCFDLTFSDSFTQRLLYFVTLFVVISLIVIHKIYFHQIFFKK